MARLRRFFIVIADADERSKGTPARCGPDMMMKSYQKIEGGLTASARRPKTRRRKK
jgi:hypothetical protein